MCIRQGMPAEFQSSACRNETLAWLETMIILVNKTTFPPFSPPAFTDITERKNCYLTKLPLALSSQPSKPSLPSSWDSSQELRSSGIPYLLQCQALIFIQMAFKSPVKPLSASGYSLRNLSTLWPNLMHQYMFKLSDGNDFRWAHTSQTPWTPAPSGNTYCLWLHAFPLCTTPQASLWVWALWLDTRGKWLLSPGKEVVNSK